MELSIRNFAIIDEITISFEKGLSVLTGETGAGKSIIIDAIGQLIGGRGSIDYIRHGSTRAEIEGLFSVENPQTLNLLLEALGLHLSEENTIILRREITSQGKSICRINGKLVTLGILREIGQTLVDIHGQHEHQHLLQTEKHLLLLDRFAEETVAKEKEEFEQLFHSFVNKREKFKQLSEGEQQLFQRLDLIQYQYDEIVAAELNINEDEQLQEEKKKLDHSEDLFKNVQATYNALYGENKGLEWLMVAMEQIDEASQMDDELTPYKELISNSYFSLEEMTFTLRNYFEGIEFNPDRLNEIEGRLNEINQLKRKYGDSVNEIMEYASKLEEEIELIKNKDDRLHDLEKELKSLAKDLLVEGKNLADIRRKEAGRLTREIQKELENLYMKDTQFEVNFSERDLNIDNWLNIKKKLSINTNGLHDISFMVSTNKGEPLKPLAKIASGGEMSRMMLALKTILASHEGVTSLIFDEVDTGVSGRVAQAIGEKIYQISFGSQVLCITHLPQVAAMADTHLYISKKQEADRVATSVDPLPTSKRIDEMTRMIAGVEITDLTIKHAEELLEQAGKTKNKCRSGQS